MEICSIAIYNYKKKWNLTQKQPSCSSSHCEKDGLNWRLQLSVTYQWKGLWARFLHYSMLFYPKMCLLPITVHAIHESWTYLCPPLCSSSFHWQHKVSIRNRVVWLPTDFVILFSQIFRSNLDSMWGSFLHCCSFVMLCNEWSIATN